MGTPKISALYLQFLIKAQYNIISVYSQPPRKKGRGLSLPKQYAEIERSESIILQYFNEKNEVIIEEKEGFEARVLQHEIDHLHGKLFVDYLSSLKRNILIKRVKKLKKMGEI